MSKIRDEIENSRTLQTDDDILNRIKNVDGIGSGLDAEFVGGVNKNQCTAWVNFDGTDGTIRDSFNVASVTKDDTGKYTITFDVEMDNNNYSGTSTNIYIDAGDDGMTSNVLHSTETSSVKVWTYNDGDSVVDVDKVAIQIFGGKA